MANCREGVKILDEDLQDLQQLDWRCVRQEKKRVAREEGHKAQADRAVDSQRKRTERHNCFWKGKIAETRRLKTGFKDKVVAMVEEKEPEN